MERVYDVCGNEPAVCASLLQMHTQHHLTPITHTCLMHTTQPSDSSSTKFEGAFLNALIYVLIVTVMTFALVLLFKYGVSGVS